MRLQEQGKTEQARKDLGAYRMIALCLLSYMKSFNFLVVSGILA